MQFYTVRKFEGKRWSGRLHSVLQQCLNFWFVPVVLGSENILAPIRKFTLERPHPVVNPIRS